MSLLDINDSTKSIDLTPDILIRLGFNIVNDQAFGRSIYKGYRYTNSEHNVYKKFQIDIVFPRDVVPPGVGTNHYIGSRLQKFLNLMNNPNQVCVKHLKTRKRNSITSWENWNDKSVIT